MKKQLIILFFLVASIETTAQSPAYKDEVFTEYFRRTSDWVASDGSISVPLPEGKSLWLMGDSYIDGYIPGDTTIPCLFQVRNALLLQDINNPSSMTTILDRTQTGVNRTPVKLAVNDPKYLWPGHGYARKDSAIVFWQAYEGPAMTHTANYVSKIFTKGMTDASAIKKLIKLPIPEAYEFGNAVVVDSARSYVYFYGMKQDWIIYRPYVARIPFGRDVTGQWEFFDGSNWSTDVNASAQLMLDANHYVSPSFSVIRLQEKYYMISQDVGFLTCGYGRDIYSWESDHPEGPFTNKKLLYTIEDKYRGEYMVTYNATAHPQFIKNNELLISYNVNGACTNRCESPFTDRFNADMYRPKFFRVALDYIDPTLNVPDPVYPGQPPVTSVKDRREEAWQVYPNPTTGLIVVTPAQRGERRTITITDYLGKIVFAMTNDGDKESIQIEKPGVYLVTISDGAALHEVRKVIVL